MKPFVAPLYCALVGSAFFAALQAPTQATPSLVSQRVVLSSGTKFQLKIANGWTIAPVAEGLKRPRFFAKAPDGRIFVTEMHDKSDNSQGAVTILDGWDAKRAKFTKVTRYLTKLRNPNSVAFWRDSSGQTWLYVALTDKLERFPFKNGDTKPSGAAQVLAHFPAYGLSYKYGGWHLTRTIAPGPDGKLYVSVGSSRNAGLEKEAVRATVLQMNPDGSNQKIWAKGLRNAVGLKWVGNQLYATNQGVDHLGDNKPADTFLALKAGGDYGWPGCYIQNGKAKVDPKYNQSDSCGDVPPTYASFPAHAAALGFEYFGANAPDARLKDRFLVALHGSGFRRIGAGYSLVTVKKGGAQSTFLTGFLQRYLVWGRPCDVMQFDSNSILMSDDYNGVIYRLRKVR